MADMYDGVNSLIALQADSDGLIAAAHYGLGLTSGVSANSSTVDGASSEFHTYAIEWGEAQIRWYIDGAHVHHRSTLSIPGPITCLEMTSLWIMQVLITKTCR